MTSLVTALKNQSFTDNGALTHLTSTSALVDWFFTSGTMREASETSIWNSWVRAFDANPEAAMKLLFYTRDILHGQGEREVSRKVFKRLAMDAERSEALADNIHLIPVYGRWDDLIVMFGTRLEDQALGLIANALENGNSLCSKWMPNEKSKRLIGTTRGYEAAAMIRDYMGISNRAYRKLRQRLNNVVETKMCNKEWDTIEFSKVPSQTMLKVRQGFHRNCKERFENWVEELSASTTKVNAKTLHPHQLVKRISNNFDYQGVERPLLSAQWAALPNYFKGHTSTKFLPLVDVSGSMMHGEGNVSPIDVAVGLGCYIAERNLGPFHNAFITFSHDPKLELLSGEDIWEKVINLRNSDWGMNTNLIAAFDLILHHAISSNISQEEMPEKILILSDMEFDESQASNWGDTVPVLNSTAYNQIQRKFQTAGYTAPQIVFWNLGASNNNVPVQSHVSGAALISGFSPSILKQLLETGNVSPIELVLEVVNSNRYEKVKI